MDKYIDKTVLVVSLIIGSVLLFTTCFVYIKYQKFGTGGGLLTLSGVILLGLSVWKSFVIPTPWGNLKAELKETQKQISTIKENVKGVENKLGTIVIQNVLANKGYYSGPVNGIMSPKLQEALVKFQKENNIAPTGKLDIATSEKLGVSYPTLFQVDTDYNWKLGPKPNTSALGVKQ